MRLSFASFCCLQRASRYAPIRFLIVSTLFELLSLYSQRSVLSRLLITTNTRSNVSAIIIDEPRQHKVLDVHDQSIRSWGCHMTDTPFLFVHIGKAGGGIVRRRLATAALNFTRNFFFLVQPRSRRSFLSHSATAN